MNRFLFTCSLLFFSVAVWGQSRVVTGHIGGTSATDSSLISAVIQEKGTGNAAESDEAGNFSITVSDTGKVVLVVTYDGYKPKEIEVGSQSNVTISLEEDVTVIEEVVIVGYGVVKKSDLTGAVSTLKPEEIAKVQTSNVLESAQGKVTGVDITRTSGSAGAKPNITIRGNRSISAGNDPLYIVDGVQYSNIEDINSNDVQSMEVLKDASSTAIYGSRGSNGVVIITTKKGKYEKGNDKLKVFFNTYTGTSAAANFPKALSGEEFVKLKREAFRNVTTGAYAPDQVVFPASGELGYVNKGEYTDYVSKLLHRGSQNNIQVGVAGATEKLQSYLSVDYYDEKGVLKMDAMKRYTARMNLDYKVNKILKVGTQTQVTHYEQTRRFNPMGRAFLVTPIGPAFDSTGLRHIPFNYAQGNPLADEEKNVFENRVETTRLFPTVYAEASPIKGLTLRSNFSFTLGNVTNGLYAGSLALQNVVNGKISSASLTQTSVNNKNFQFVANYMKDIKDHSFTFTALSELVEGKQLFVSTSGQNLIADYQSFYNLAAASTNIKVGSSYTKSDIVSFAGRVNYAYKHKYLLTATGRYDGSSVLAEGNKWDFFPSVAGAWKLTEEKFLLDQKIFSEIKLRASVGVAGNSSVAPYSSQTLLNRLPYSWDEVGSPAYGYSPTVGNTNLKWEKSKTVDIGLDLGILENRIQFTGDIYQTNTSDLLLLRNLPSSTGASSVYDNVGSTLNKGIELGVTSTNIRKKDFSWSSTVTFMKNKEEITGLTGGVKSLEASINGVSQWLIVGSPVMSFYDYEKIGIWQLGEETAAAKLGRKPGQIKIKNQNPQEDTIITTADRKVLGSNVPKFSLGFNNSFKYKSIEMSFYFYARVGQMVNLFSNATIYDQKGTNNSANVGNFDYWTPENPTNNLPRPNTTGADTYVNTIGYYDGSFLKLRSVNISYVLPKSVSKKYLRAENVKVYAAGRNLLTFSKIKNYDPEMNGGFTNPLVRLYTVGINVEF